ncbi:hypothetical protein NE865_06665 [Phthorimaea operculella]|nr:hypothetical protein NE865_06665 [Phthorimaea operculella]
MASVSLQRDLVVTFKQETLLNVGILSKFYPTSSDLSRLLKENNLEKPTQNLFNHLAHYLVNIIDPKVSLPWPLYDTKTERTYRNELSVFITNYSNKGLLAPVMSSYLVNPGCYKVIFLMFQMSQLAIQSMLLTKMKKDSQKTLYNEMTEKYKTHKEDGFIESIERETDIMLSKFSNYLGKKEALEEIAKKIRDQITKNQEKLTSSKAQELIGNLVDGYIKTHPLDEEAKTEILQVKVVEKPAKIFDKWLESFDNQLTEMEKNWEIKTSPMLNISQTTFKNTETLIARQTGEADKRTFMIEFNPKTDNLFTDELEKLVNTQQKYILKNIVKEEKLNFPNLIRGFLISICFILKNAEIGDEVYQFNEYLEGGRRNYTEVVNAMKTLLDRVMNAEGKLQVQQNTFHSPMSTRDITEIPPLPDLSDLKMNRDQPQILFDSFTPLSISKHQFNLRKQKTGSFMKPLPKVFATPFHAPKDDFFKSLISCRVSAYDNMNITQNTNLNMSVMSHVRSNETIAECTSGFTKQQICRLLSTKKKSSSSKKFKHKIERPNIKIKKGGLFNDSTFSNESISMFRSHSSPNLYENRERNLRDNLRARKLSIMKENSPSLLEVSGIAALERDSNHSTPQGLLDSSRKLETASIPSIVVTPRSDVSDNLEVDLNKEIEFKEPQMVLPQRRSKEKNEERQVLPHRKSRLPQPMNKKNIENPHIMTQKVIETFEEHIVLSPQNIPNMIEVEKVIVQQRSKEIFEEQTVLPQRISLESNEQQAVLTQRKSVEFTKEETKVETPKTNPPQNVKKTSSLEKIINRFKKVRASVLPSEPREDNDFKTIFEEKENHNFVNVEDVFTANRNLLPDLLSPSCSIIKKSNSDVLDQLIFDDDDDDKPTKSRKPRESLGTALGVDHTFLDQFDLID